MEVIIEGLELQSEEYKTLYEFVAPRNDLDRQYHQAEVDRRCGWLRGRKIMTLNERERRIQWELATITSLQAEWLWREQASAMCTLEDHRERVIRAKYDQRSTYVQGPLMGPSPPMGPPPVQGPATSPAGQCDHLSGTSQAAETDSATQSDVSSDLDMSTCVSRDQDVNINTEHVGGHAHQHDNWKSTWAEVVKARALGGASRHGELLTTAATGTPGVPPGGPVTIQGLEGAQGPRDSGEPEPQLHDGLYPNALIEELIEEQMKADQDEREGWESMDALQQKRCKKDKKLARMERNAPWHRRDSARKPVADKHVQYSLGHHMPHRRPLAAIGPRITGPGDMPDETQSVLMKKVSKGWQCMCCNWVMKRDIDRRNHVCRNTR